MFSPYVIDCDSNITIYWKKAQDVNWNFLEKIILSSCFRPKNGKPSPNSYEKEQSGKGQIPLACVILSIDKEEERGENAAMGLRADGRERMQLCLDYMESHLCEPLTAERLSRFAGYSVYHFCRLFHAAVGLPVRSYLVRRRLLHAAYAIGGGESLFSAALDCGFSTYAGFYKAFRREFGVSPGQYRMRYGGKEPPRVILREEGICMVSRQTLELFLKEWDLEGAPTSAMPASTGGPSQTVFQVGEQYVLKLADTPGQLLRHAEVAKALADAGLCAAVPVPARDGRELVEQGGLFGFLSRRLEGKPLCSAELYAPGGLEKAEEVGRAVGRLDRALVTAEAKVDDVDLVRQLREDSLPKVQKLLSLPEALCTRYLTSLERVSPALPRQIIHRDPHLANLFSGPQGWGFLDFDLAERSIRLFDPCYTCTSILSETYNLDGGAHREEWFAVYHALLSGYDEEVSLTAQEREAAPLIVLAIECICTAWFAGKDELRPLFDANSRMIRWLFERQDRLRLP